MKSARIKEITDVKTLIREIVTASRKRKEEQREQNRQKENCNINTGELLLPGSSSGASEQGGSLRNTSASSVQYLHLNPWSTEINSCLPHQNSLEQNHVG
jgi:hypothetical protein